MSITIIESAVRDASRVPGESVYVLLLGDEVRYVGRSSNPLARIGGHIRAAAIGFDRYYIHECRCSAQVERSAIRASSPPQNVQHRYGGDVISGRVDPGLVNWGCAHLGTTKSELLRMALDDFIARLVREAA